MRSGLGIFWFGKARGVAFFALLLALLLANAQPAFACAAECPCPNSRPRFGTFLTNMFRNQNRMLENLMGAGITNIFRTLLGQIGQTMTRESITARTATSTALTDVETTNQFSTMLARGNAKVAKEYIPSRSVCIQLLRQQQMSQIDLAYRQAIPPAIDTRLTVLNGDPGTPAERGEVAANANLFLKYAQNNCASTMPAGVPCTAPMGAFSNISTAGSILNRQQIANPNEYNTAQDVTTLIFAGALRNKVDGAQLVNPTARAMVQGMRKDTQGYLLASSVFTEQIETLRPPTDFGVTVTPDSFFTKPQSYKTLREHYLAGLDSLEASSTEQDSEKGAWEALSSQLDSNSRLMFKIFERTEKWALLRAFVLKGELGEAPSFRNVLPAVQK